jgi:flagellin-like hook-associated protein FlgL
MVTYQDVEWLIWPKQCHSLAALPPSSGHTLVACFRPKRAKKAFSTQTGRSAKMDSLLSAPSEQRHRDNVAPLVPEPTAVTARLDGPMHDFDGWFAAATIAAQPIDAAAEESCPAPTVEAPRAEPPSVEIPIQNATPLPTADIQPPQLPSPTASKLMDQLDELASDLAAKGHPASEKTVETIPQASNASAEPQAVEPSIQVPPRGDFGHTAFAAGSQPGRQRMIITSVGVCLAALLGAAIAWQSDFGGPSKSANDSNAAATKQAIPAVAQASAPKTVPAQPTSTTQAAAPTPSPELAKQLDTMVQDLAAVRRSVEQLTAKQEQLAAAQQQLDQLAAKQTQLVAKQEQLAQNIAKLQATEQSVKPRTTPPTQSRAAVLPPPSRTIPEPPVQVAPPQRVPSHPVPPMPIPQ